MLIIFFDIQGIFQKEFVLPSQTVNGKFYCEVLKQLREGIRRKRPDKWKKQLVSPPWQHTRSHITCCSTIPDFQKHYSDSPPLLFTWPRPLQHFPIPHDKITVERASFWHDWGDPRRNARGYQHTHISELPGMHQNMGNTLKSLYTCPRGLCWRRQWKPGVMVRNFF